MVKHQRPPMKTSDEANQDQLQLATTQGMTYVKALKHMAQEVADDGGEKLAGEYIVAYAVEKAEGMYHYKNGELEWRDPEPKNVHIEVSVRDGADHRFIPALTVSVTLITPDGREVGTHQQPYLWHPWLYHYGRNWKVDQSGEYTLKVHIDTPEFSRHDEKNGKRFAEPVDVEFQNVKIYLDDQPEKLKTIQHGDNERLQIWISPAENGQWRVHASNSDEVLFSAATQQEAIDQGKKYAEAHTSELIIQGEDGQIRDRRSYGSDPYPPKG